jgi:hypothetical protein
MGSQREVRATREPTGCKHAIPKLRASNDRRGKRENLGFGREKRRPSTGGSAKGIPECEGLRRGKLGHDERDNDRTSEEFQVGRSKTLSYEGRTSELHARRVAAAVDGSQQGGQEEGCEKVRPHDVPASLLKVTQRWCFARRKGGTPSSKMGN